MKVQPFLAAIAVLYAAAAIYSAFRGDWRMAAINVAYSVSGAVFSTMGR